MRRQGEAKVLRIKREGGGADNEDLGNMICGRRWRGQGNAMI